MMVRGIKARAFEHNADRRVNLVQALFATFRATGQCSVAEFLLAIELHAAGSATVSVNGHTFSFILSLPGEIIAQSERGGKGRLY